MSTWRPTLWVPYGYESTSVVDTSQSMLPGTYGAAPQERQRALCVEAMGWIDGTARSEAFAEPKHFDRFGDWFGTHLLTDTTDAVHDFWDFASASRRADRPQRRLAFRSAPRNADVVVMWVPDPTPGQVAYGLLRDHYFVRYGEDGVIEVRLWNRLGASPPLIGMAGEDRYYMEVCFKGLLEAWLLIAEENWPGTIAELGGSFGARASWDSGQLEAQVKFAVLEHMKDLLFSARVTNGRPIRRLTRDRYRVLCEKFIGRPRMPKGPCDAIFSGGVISGYTMPVAGLPLPPRPVWSPLGSGEGYQGPGDYDHPMPSTIPGPGVRSFDGDGWFWGGRRGGAGGGITIKPPDLSVVDRDTPLRPPAPGSRVHFRVEWTDPLGPLPSGPSELMTDPRTGEQLDPGIFVFDMGQPRQVRAGGAEFGGPEGIAGDFGVGVVWCMGDDPAVPYNRFALPDGLYVGRGIYRDPPPGSQDEHFDPILFDFSKAGVWDFWLTVPDHGGQLALKFAWHPPYFNAVSGFSGHYPIQTVLERPSNAENARPPSYTQFPRAKLQPPPVLPEGFVETQAVPAGQVRVDEAVHGNLSEEVVLFDPLAHGISTVRHA